MREHLKTILVALTLLAVGGGGTWMWYDAMELRWRAQPYVSPAARENRMLAATRLLGETGHKVSLAATINDISIKALPDGTLLVSDVSGVVAPEQARALLAWVRRGNTLVAQPRWLTPAEKAQLQAAAQGDKPAAAEDKDEGKDEEKTAEEEGDGEPADEDEDEEEGNDEGEESAPAEKDKPARELVETDPLAAHLGVRLFYQARKPGDNRVPLGSVTVPGTAYPLELGPGAPKLVSLPGAAAPAWADTKGTALRVYTEGRGHIVMMASDYFDNGDLKRYDHGELLLALARLNPRSTDVTIIKNLDVPKWYKALWDRYQLALLAAGATLALMLWAAVRRFGPVLPEPNRERRSLIEHIDASGAWLWKADGGRAVLLDAARKDTFGVLQRRVPAIMRLPLLECRAALAQACGLLEDDIDAALYQDALRDMHQFTRQIRTLQELRNHYER